MSGARRPVKRAGATSVGEATRDARDAAEGKRRKKRAPGRQSDTVKRYEEEEAKARLGDHAITPELVRGTGPHVSREVIVSRSKGPAAAPIIADLLTVQWAEILHLRDQQQSTGAPLPADQFEKLRDLADGVTKVLREERRQNELDDWSRLTTAEILQTLPPEYQQALGGVLPGSTSEEE